MAQFDVYLNSGKGAKAAPFLVDVQHNLLSGCNTRVVIPLLSAKIARERNMDFVENANPLFMFGDTEVVLAAHLMTAIHAKELGGVVGSIASMRPDILAAMDVIFSGV
jgi:toxin CcdB